jgi:hypothetical protein
MEDIEKLYLNIPTDETLESPKSWQKLGDSTFSVIQAHIVGVKRREKKIYRGPLVDAQTLPGGTKYQIQVKTATVTKNAGEIQESIQETVSDKFSDKIATKIAAEIGSRGPMPSGKLSTELQADASAELTDAVQNTVTRNCQAPRSRA